MRAEDVVKVVEQRGTVGLQDQLGISRQRAEALDVEARRMIGLGFGESEVGRSLTASAIARQQALRHDAPEVTADTARVLAALDRLEAGPTGDELASRLAEDRRRDVEARNAVGAESNRTYAARLRRGGYAGFTQGQR